MNSSDVVEAEELSETRFKDPADSAGISTSIIFSSVSWQYSDRALIK